jgi:hypothetical protein
MVTVFAVPTVPVAVVPVTDTVKVGFRLSVEVLVPVVAALPALSDTEPVNTTIGLASAASASTVKNTFWEAVASAVLAAYTFAADGTTPPTVKSLALTVVESKFSSKRTRTLVLAVVTAMFLVVLSHLSPVTALDILGAAKSTL